MNHPNRLATALLLLGFAAVFMVLTVNSYTQKSATWDEPQHLTAGYMALRFHDYRTDLEHPPLLRMWAALPLLAMPNIQISPALIDQSPPAAWAGKDQFIFSHQFMYEANDGDRMLYRARFMIALLGVLLGVLLFFWAQEWLGFWPATMSLAFYCIEPNILAHSSLLTTDLGMTCFFFGTLYFLWRTTRALTAGNLTGLTVFCALSVVSKYSAPVLAPIVLALLAVHAARATPWICRIGQPQEITSRTTKGLIAAAIALLLALVSWGAIWAIYSFRYAPSATPAWQYGFSENAWVLKQTPSLARIAAWIDAHRLFPNAYTEGFLLSQAKAQGRSAFLAGHYSVTGWWYYFPVAFLIKTPLSLVMLMIGGLAVCAKHWRTFLRDEAFVLLPVVCYLAPAMAAKLNIGLRHILPIYPFVLLLTALAAAEFIKSKQKTARMVLVVLYAFLLLEFARVYPHTLAFFNSCVGGPDKGYEYLADSSLDWGQDLKPLKAWMDKHNVPHINLAYFGTADPAYYKMQCTWLPGAPFFAENLVGLPQLPGYVAVSATILDGQYLDPIQRRFYRPLLAREPQAVIGYSIGVYWADRPWW